MDKCIIINGEIFLSENLLVDAMVKNCVAYTETSDCCVSGNESDLVNAYQELLSQKEIPAHVKALFRDKYVHERFIKRSEGF